MSNITIGRYEDEVLAETYSGYLEGVRTDGSRWIIYLDGDGAPALYWANREEDGAVIGESVTL